MRSTRTRTHMDIVLLAALGLSLLVCVSGVITCTSSEATTALSAIAGRDVPSFDNADEYFKNGDSTYQNVGAMEHYLCKDGNNVPVGILSGRCKDKKCVLDCLRSNRHGSEQLAFWVNKHGQDAGHGLKKLHVTFMATKQAYPFYSNLQDLEGTEEEAGASNGKNGVVGVSFRGYLYANAQYVLRKSDMVIRCDGPQHQCTFVKLTGWHHGMSLGNLKANNDKCSFFHNEAEAQADDVVKDECGGEAFETCEKKIDKDDVDLRDLCGISDGFREKPVLVNNNMKHSLLKRFARK